MAHSENEKLAKVYAATTPQEQKDAYDDWAQDYERDVNGFGIRIPAIAAIMFARHVDPDFGPYLDAACGTGMQTEMLSLVGYSDFYGIDISPGMLKEARKKDFYTSLAEMTLGEPLRFSDNKFEACYCVGALAPGHAPPVSMDEMLRVTRPGGHVIFSMHSHDSPETREFQRRRTELQRAGLWDLVDMTEPFISMPDGDANILHSVYVYKVSESKSA